MRLFQILLFMDEILNVFGGEAAGCWSHVEVSDSDVPSGAGGINRERYTCGQLGRQPIIPGIIRCITDPAIRLLAEECNWGNRSGFVMRRANGEYCFDGLRVGPKVAPMPDNWTHI